MAAKKRTAEAQRTITRLQAEYKEVDQLAQRYYTELVDAREQANIEARAARGALAARDELRVVVAGLRTDLLLLATRTHVKRRAGR